MLRAAGVALSVVVLVAGCSRAEPDARSAPADAVTSAPTETASAPTTRTSSPAVTGTTAAKPKPQAPTSQPPKAPAATSTPSAADSPTTSSAPESSAPNGAEMPPAEDGTVSPTPTGLPGLTAVRPDPPLISLPLPRSAVATGRLVAGFPSFLRAPNGSGVDTSSIATDQDRMQVALGGTTAATPEQILRAYRTRLTSRGMEEQDTPTIAGSVAAAFVRGTSTITVTVSREGARTTYSVYGALQAGKA